ncbi:MAG: ribonuclease HII [Sulfolobaceae archaeon]|nr:ribonuclease HII [Sulfolobaceae archaeon]
MRKLGIDEAGRGSLIGPMVIAGVIIDDKVENLLREIGVKDSKRLSPRTRDRLFWNILDVAEGVIVARAYPDEIDSNNLNSLTYQKILQIIHASLPLSPQIVTIDKVGDENIVIEEIKRLQLVPNVVFNADVLYIESSAASIVAKVVRDSIIAELRKIYGDFGSGYPSDQKTTKWVMEMYKENEDRPPPIIRRSWKILRTIAPKYYIEKVI